MPGPPRAAKAARRPQTAETVLAATGCGPRAANEEARTNVSDSNKQSRRAVEGEIWRGSAGRLLCRKCKKPRLASAFLTKSGHVGEVCVFCKHKIISAKSAAPLTKKEE
jgi:hypothetical protein